jgi:hypothetical protein
MTTGYEYPVGTIDDVYFILTNNAPDDTFDIADWTVEVALTNIDSKFSAAAETWEDGELLTANGVDYVKVQIGVTIGTEVGIFDPYIRLTPVGGAPPQPIVKASPTIEIAD